LKFCKISDLEMTSLLPVKVGGEVELHSLKAHGTQGLPPCKIKAASRDATSLKAMVKRLPPYKIKVTNQHATEDDTLWACSTPYFQR
jgi:hypothetical protein